MREGRTGRVVVYEEKRAKRWLIRSGLGSARNDFCPMAKAPTRSAPSTAKIFYFFSSLSLSPFFRTPLLTSSFSRRHLRPLHRVLVHKQGQGAELVQEEGAACPGEQRGGLFVVLAEARRRRRERCRCCQAGCCCCSRRCCQAGCCCSRCCCPRRQGQARRGQGRRASRCCSCCSRSCCCCCSGGALGRRLVWRRRCSQQRLINLFIFQKNKNLPFRARRFSVGPFALSSSSLQYNRNSSKDSPLLIL